MWMRINVNVLCILFLFYMCTNCHWGIQKNDKKIQINTNTLSYKHVKILNWIRIQQQQQQHKKIQQQQQRKKIVKLVFLAYRMKQYKWRFHSNIVSIIFPSCRVLPFTTTHSCIFSLYSAFIYLRHTNTQVKNEWVSEWGRTNFCTWFSSNENISTGPTKHLIVVLLVCLHVYMPWVWVRACVCVCVFFIIIIMYVQFICYRILFLYLVFIQFELHVLTDSFFLLLCRFSTFEPFSLRRMHRRRYMMNHLKSTNFFSLAFLYQALRIYTY